MADPWNNINSAVTSWHFVDNTDQDMLDTRGTLIIDKLVEHICWAGLLWEFLLLISGGSPYLAKCLWTLQYWQLAIGNWQLIRGQPQLLPHDINGSASSHDKWFQPWTPYYLPTLKKYRAERSGWAGNEVLRCWCTSSERHCQMIHLHCHRGRLHNVATFLHSLAQQIPSATMVLHYWLCLLLT